MKYKRKAWLSNRFNKNRLANQVEKMGRQGWFLTKIEPLCFTFVKGEPKDLKAEVVLLPTIGEFGRENALLREEFFEMAQRDGWIPQAYIGNLYVFANEEESPKPLETDPEVEIQALTQVIKREYLGVPLFIAFLNLINVHFQIKSFQRFPLEFFSGSEVIFFLFFLFLSAVLLVQVLVNGLWIRKAVRTAEEKGVALSPPSDRPFLILLALGTAFLLFFLPGLESKFFLLGFAGILLFSALVRLFRRALDKRDFGKRKNFLVTMIIVLAFSLVFTGGLPFLLLRQVKEERNEGAKGTYYLYGRPLPRYEDNLPVTMEELGIFQGETSRRREVNSTPFATNKLYHERALAEGGEYLTFSVTTSRFPRVLSLIKTTLLKKEDNEGKPLYRRETSLEKEEVQVYQKYWNSSPAGEYVLLDKGCLLLVDSSVPLSPRQMDCLARRIT